MVRASELPRPDGLPESEDRMSLYVVLMSSTPEGSDCVWLEDWPAEPTTNLELAKIMGLGFADETANQLKLTGYPGAVPWPVSIKLGKRARPYAISEEGADWSFLVFAADYRAALKLGSPIARGYDDCRYDAVEVKALPLDSLWLYQNKELPAWQPEVVECPRACRVCDQWQDQLNDGGICAKGCEE